MTDTPVWETHDNETLTKAEIALESLRVRRLWIFNCPRDCECSICWNIATTRRAIAELRKETEKC